MATHTEYTKQEWKIAVLEDDLAALQEENEQLKARIERLRKYIRGKDQILVAYRIGGRPRESTWKLLDQIQPGDLEDPAPTLPVLGEECTERLDAPLAWEGE